MSALGQTLPQRFHNTQPCWLAYVDAPSAVGTLPVSSIDTEDYDLLIDALRGAREMAGIGQETLAKRLGMSKTYVYKVEEKRRRLDVVEFASIVEALGLSPQELFNSWMQRRALAPSRAKSAQDGAESTATPK